MYMQTAIEELRKLKDAKGFSQEKLAREIGVSLQTVNRWLIGKFNPSVHVLDKIDKFLQQNQ